MIMKLSSPGNVRFNTVKAHSVELAALQKMHGRLGCVRYFPVSHLEEAFDHYGHLEIYADGTARRLLNDPTIARKFISNQRAGRGFEDNLKDTFSGHELIAVKHEQEPLYFFANPKNLAVARKIALIETCEHDEERDGRWPIQRPGLVEIDGGLVSGPNQTLQTLMIGSWSSPKRSKKF